MAITVRKVRKEMKCSGVTEMLYYTELFHDTTRKSENHELIRVVSRFPATFHLFSNSVRILYSRIYIIQYPVFKLLKTYRMKKAQERMEGTRGGGG